MTSIRPCPHCGRPTRGTVLGYCSWDCHDHAGDERPRRDERDAA